MAAPRPQAPATSSGGMFSRDTFEAAPARPAAGRPALQSPPPPSGRSGPFAPGALWVDPHVMGGQVRNGVVINSQFPDAKTPVTTAPSAMDAAVGRRPMEYVDSSGATRKASSPEEYRAQISSNRAAAGIPELGGEPVGVHMAFQGGGGAGKRYPAAINEMAAQGIVPTSVSGASAGAITAGFVAAGATPARINEIVQDKGLAGLMDYSILGGRGGLMDGDAAYKFFDQKLRDVTGITDRPVTFRDLPMPLQIIATKGSDTQRGVPDMSIPTNRAFVFSQQTTPDTPVALAMRASMAIPGAFDPVKAQDPVTGRRIEFTDGGVVDNLPLGYQQGKMPVVGLAPIYPEDSHPADHTAQMRRTYEGDAVGGWTASNGYRGYRMNNDAAAPTRDWRDRTQPQPNHFMLGLPTWTAADPTKQDTLLDFGWNKQVDGQLDRETRAATQQFFRGALPQMGDPNARATNVNATVPKQISFTRPVTVDGKTYDAHYSSSHLKGDTVYLRPRGPGATETLTLGRQRIESMFLDDRNFGGNRLQGYIGDEFRKLQERVDAMGRAMGAMN